MLIRDLLESTALAEVKMSASALRARASRIEGALVGMEFEMYVPSVTDPDAEPDWEPDYEQDGYISTGTWRDFARDVINFFTSGEFPSYSRRDMERILDQTVEPEYLEWLEAAWSEYADDNFEEWYLENNPDEEEPPPTDSRAYDQAREEFRNERFNDWANEGDRINDWLEDNRIDRYLRFSERYELDWPHMTDVRENGDWEISDVAKDFSDAVGIPADHSSSYHTVKQKAGRYLIEPDGSLTSPDSPGDAGLEFVSPPMGIAEAIDQLEKVRRWAGQIGAYTNSSTGLHINVSIPGYSSDQLDYVKLVLFLGDEWVSRQFGRLGNSYAKSSAAKIRSRIRTGNVSLDSAFLLMKKGLSNIAAHMLHGTTTDKYVTVNVKDNRIEFRSPGGDWLDANYDKIVTAMLRFVVAMDIAIDPGKERQEYAKKLYKIISTNQPTEDLDTLRYFSLYSAGELPATALKSFVRNIQQKRSGKKQLPSEEPKLVPAAGDAQQGRLYVITNDSDGTPRHSFRAATPTEAIRIGSEWARSQGIPETELRLQLAPAGQ